MQSFSDEAFRSTYESGGFGKIVSQYGNMHDCCPASSNYVTVNIYFLYSSLKVLVNFFLKKWASSIAEYYWRAVHHITMTSFYRSTSRGREMWLWPNFLGSSLGAAHLLTFRVFSCSPTRSFGGMVSLLSTRIKSNTVTNRPFNLWRLSKYLTRCLGSSLITTSLYILITRHFLFQYCIRQLNVGSWLTSVAPNLCD